MVMVYLFVAVLQILVMGSGQEKSAKSSGRILFLRDLCFYAVLSFCFSHQNLRNEREHLEVLWASIQTIQRSVQERYLCYILLDVLLNVERGLARCLPCGD